MVLGYTSFNNAIASALKSLVLPFLYSMILFLLFFYLLRTVAGVAINLYLSSSSFDFSGTAKYSEVPIRRITSKRFPG
jgi:hypothetical protein